MNSISARVGFLLLLVVGLSHQIGISGEHHTLRFLNPNSRHPQPAHSLAIAPDGSELAFCVEPNRVVFVRLADGEIIDKVNETATDMAYSKDGSRLLMFTMLDGFKLLEAKSRAIQKVETEEQPGFLGMRTIEKNGKLLIDTLMEGGPAARSGKLKVGDEVIGFADGKVADVEDAIGLSPNDFSKKLRGPARTFVRIEISRKGIDTSEIVTLQRQAGRLGANELVFTDNQPVVLGDNLIPFKGESVRYSFASAADGKVIGSLSTEHIRPFGPSAAFAAGARFAALGTMLKDERKAAIEIFDLAKLERVKTIPFEGTNYSHMIYGADGQELFVASRDRVHVYSPETGAFLRSYMHDGKLNKKATDDPNPNDDFPRPFVRQPLPRFVELIAASSKLLAITAPWGSVNLLDLQTGEILKTFKPTNVSTFGPSPTVKQFAFSRDGKWFIYYVNGVLNIVDVSDLPAPKKSEP